MMSLVLSVSSTMRSARSRIEISCAPPRLNACPQAAGVLGQRAPARARCRRRRRSTGSGVPSPNTVSGLAAQRLADQVGHHHAVAPGLARADRVEQPRDGHLQPVLAPVGVREGLVDALGCRVGPPAHQRGAQDAVGVLVQARRRCSCRRSRWWRPAPSTAPGAQRGLQDVLGAVQVDPQGLQRLLDDAPHADRSGQVEHPIGTWTMISVTSSRSRTEPSTQPEARMVYGLDRRLSGDAGGEVVEHGDACRRRRAGGR